MDHADYAARARRVFFQPAALEDEAAFRTVLTQLTRTGLQWGGLLGIIGVGVLIFVHAGLLGRPTTWWYPAGMSADVFVLWDKAMVVLACAGAIVLGWSECRLSVGRLVGSAIALGVAAVTLIHDAYRGILSVEYLVLVYLLAVAVIPYRPWQAFVLGLALTLVFYLLGTYGLLGTAAARPELVTPAHIVRMGFGTVVLTGVSGLLYGTRYQQHRARRTAEDLHEQVAELERAKSRFFADVSHEFRTPLTLILGSVREGLAGRLGDLPEPISDRLEVMLGQVRRMKRLVNQLLELSEVDDGGLRLAMQEYDLVALARYVTPPFRQWAEEQDISLQTKFETEPLEVWVDPDRFAEMVGNLLEHAIEHTPEGGTVRMRIGRTDTSAEISIRDTGPGLPAGLQARVFGQDESAIPVGAGDAPVGSETSERWIGMGIGLAHVRALVERHGGQIDVESEPGFGTEYTIRLPLGDAHVSDEDVAETEGKGRLEEEVTDYPVGHDHRTPIFSDDEAEHHGVDGEVPVVVVVDDEPEMQGYLRSLFEPDYEVVTARDGDEALELLRDQRPDLVISDTAMPVRDGVSLCRAIRSDEELRSLPVILFTAQSDDDARLGSLRAGADAYVAKPFDPLELEARVENLIEIRQLVQKQVRMPEWMEPKEPSVSSEEGDFLEVLNETVDEHIDNSNFGVDWLADEMDLSTRHLRRRLKDVTRLSPAGFIRTRRLQHAATLLERGENTVSGVASAVGYRDASYFSRLFRETYGCPPSEYAEEAPEGRGRADAEQ